MMRLFLFIFSLLIIFSCSSTDNKDKNNSGYEKQEYQISKGIKDTIFYYDIFSVVVDTKNEDNDLLLEITHNREKISYPDDWSSNLRNIELKFLSADSSNIDTLKSNYKINFYYKNISDVSDPLYLSISEIYKGNLKILNSFIDYRSKNIWSISNKGSAIFSLGLLKSPADTINHILSIRMPVSYDGFNGLPDYELPSDVPVLYNYNYFKVKSLDEIIEPLLLKKSTDFHIPKIILNFYSDANKKIVNELNNDQNVQNHIDLIIQKLKTFGSKNFDGINVDYSNSITTSNINFFVDFIKKFKPIYKENFPNKYLLISLPYFFVKDLVQFDILDSLDYLYFSYTPLSYGDSLVVDSLNIPDYSKIEENFISNKWLVDFNKIIWEINPALLFFNKYDKYVVCDSINSLFKYFKFANKLDSVKVGDSLDLRTIFYKKYNNFINGNSILQWDDNKLCFYLDSDNNKIVFYNTKSINYIIDFLQRMNIGGINLLNIRKENNNLVSYLRYYFYNKFYPLEKIKKEDFEFEVSYIQKVYDSSYNVRDSIFEPIVTYSFDNIKYQVEKGVKREDKVLYVLRYKANEINDTLSYYVYNSMPIFNFKPPYSTKINSIFRDTIKVFDPDNDTVNVDILKPQDAKLIEDSIIEYTISSGFTSGDKISFSLKASDKIQDNYYNFEILLTDQYNKEINIGDNILEITTPEMIYIPEKYFYYGNDTLYQEAVYDTTFENDITYIKLIDSRSLVWCKFLKDYDNYLVRRFSRDSLNFIYDTVNISSGDTLYLPLKTKHFYQDEIPIRRLKEGKFFCGVYEVMNKEYVQFVLDSGYYKQQYWSDEGWQVKTDSQWYVPKGWGTVTYYNKSISSDPDAPVVGISYYEAEAYVNWLNDKFNAKFKIPDQIEWERVATGPEYIDTVYTDSIIYSLPFRDFPWGNTFISSYLVFAESDSVQKPCSEYSHFDGKSYEGVCHLLGNALEWTSSKVGDKFILRGGSFKFQNFTDIFHNKIKFSLHPATRREDVGFRVIRID